jgi:hypothetical protein
MLEHLQGEQNEVIQGIKKKLSCGFYQPKRIDKTELLSILV